MFNRILMIVSISIMLIIIVFNVIIYAYVLSMGYFVYYSLNMVGITYLIFFISIVIGLILSIRSYLKKDTKLLLIATILYFISSLPSIIYGVFNPSLIKTPYILLQLVLPSLILNIIQLLMIKKGIKN